MSRMRLTLPPTLIWNGSELLLLDQTRLPTEETYLAIDSVDALYAAIKRLVVRGAPAIGCAAAYGCMLAAREVRDRAEGTDWLQAFDTRLNHLASARPTAVNLSWAVERCRKVAHAAQAARQSRSQIMGALEREAQTIHNEDREMCEAIGFHGASLLPPHKATLITHCNAGALATGGAGTALSVMYAAHSLGIELKVFADETRPLLQGARLTAWELSRCGIEVTVICDNMAASVMRSFKPDAVIVGADRIAANGDTANKIGTYGLAIMAAYHGIPFYVAAPSSTFDLSLVDGTAIPIEERARSEVASPYAIQCVPEAANVYNPAFDVAPASLISAIVTEKGVLRTPYTDSIKTLFA